MYTNVPKKISHLKNKLFESADLANVNTTDVANVNTTCSFVTSSRKCIFSLGPIAILEGKQMRDPSSREPFCD